MPALLAGTLLLRISWWHVQQLWGIIDASKCPFCQAAPPLAFSVAFYLHHELKYACSLPFSQAEKRLQHYGNIHLIAWGGIQGSCLSRL